MESVNPFMTEAVIIETSPLICEANDNGLFHERVN